MPFQTCLDTDIEATVGAKTLRRYRKALGGLISFLSKNGLMVENISEIDAAAILYKNHVTLTRSEIDYLIASLEFFFPGLKDHKLPYLKRVAAGRARAVRTCHTVPLVSRVCRYYCACMCLAFKQTRMGFALVLQQALGLRPGEVRPLLSDHVLVPHGGIGNFVFRLGAFVGTKVHREQFAILSSFEHIDIAYVLLKLLRNTPPGSRLFPFSYYQYNQGIKDSERLLGVKVGGTPHGARAGFASEAAANGASVAEIMAKGRWGTEPAMRAYIDVIVASQVTAMVSLSAHNMAMDKACALFYTFFTDKQFLSELGCHANQELSQSGQRVVAEGAGSASCLPGAEPYVTYAERHSRQASTAGPGEHAGATDHAAAVASREPADASASASGAAKGVVKGRGKGRSKLVIPKNFL